MTYHSLVVNYIFCFLIFPGSNSELTYLIPDGLAGNLFSIGADDGIIRTRQSLDRETQSLWIVTGMRGREILETVQIVQELCIMLLVKFY